MAIVFDVRIDAGSNIDVGAAHSHTFSSLTPSTTYIAEVRARDTADGNTSVWVPVTFTTLAIGYVVTEMATGAPLKVWMGGSLITVKSLGV